MTLNTHIRLEGTVPLREVFDFALSILTSPGQEVRTCALSYGHGLMTEPGQGLVGWLSVKHEPDGPTGCPHWSHEDPEWDDEDPTHDCLPPASCTISLDTVYGYKAENGAGCQDLHAWFITRVYAWCLKRAIPIRWQNEFTREWFSGINEIDSFGDAIRGKPAADELALRA